MASVPATMKALQYVFYLVLLNRSMQDPAAIICGPCCASLLTLQSDRYEKPEVYGIVEIPVPTLRENDVLV